MRNKFQTSRTNHLIIIMKIKIKYINLLFHKIRITHRNTKELKIIKNRPLIFKIIHIMFLMIQIKKKITIKMYNLKMITIINKILKVMSI